ncbi:selenocysteine-specific translation elongation factor [bacterium]|nr:selenocysteine-specific translation elongation factor [candidate division CSSED10-310 bacterium]
MEKHIILGTAGHIDHGKTTLIRSLTGINTDRLPEEQKRGITIELGFAHMSFPGGIELGVVDVPGHERFVHHMVAGVGGMDMVMLVVAADEGIMPQTREHLAICDLLGVHRGLIALTKIDMVDAEWIDLVREDLEEYLRHTWLAGAPIVPVSAVTGVGLDALQRVLHDMAAEIEPRQSAGPFRLPIDRAFSIRGFGTVVTGTVASGGIHRSDPVAMIPGYRECRIRGIQVHNQDTDRVQAGQRAAINLQNVDKDEIRRGMILTRPHTIPETVTIDADCRILASCDKGVRNRSPIRFHSGTSEILGRIVVLDRERIEPKETAPVQFILIEPTAVLPGDRFIIRSYSPVQTIGGGIVLDAEPVRHKRLKPETIRHFEDLRSDVPLHRLRAHLDTAGAHGLSRTDIQRRFPDPSINLDALIDTAITNGIARGVTSPAPRFISETAWTRLADKALEMIDRYHRTHRLRPGISREALKTQIKPVPPPEVLTAILDHMIDSGRLIEEKSVIRTPAFQPALSPDEIDAVARITTRLDEAGFSGMTTKEIQDALGLSGQDMKTLFQYVLDLGTVVRLPGGLIMASHAVNDLHRMLCELFASSGAITVGMFRDAAGVSRKQAVPILEYFDSVGVTRRRGDERILIEK